MVQFDVFVSSLLLNFLIEIKRQIYGEKMLVFCSKKTCLCHVLQTVLFMTLKITKLLSERNLIKNFYKSLEGNIINNHKKKKKLWTKVNLFVSLCLT